MLELIRKIPQIKHVFTVNVIVTILAKNEVLSVFECATTMRRKLTGEKSLEPEHNSNKTTPKDQISCAGLAGIRPY
jgi:hypothetical protein